MILFFFLIVFLGVFGPKFGFVDVSVLVGSFFLIVLAAKKNIVISQRYLILVLLVGLIFIYSILVYINNQSASDWILTRSLRALLNTMFLGVVAYNFPIPTLKKINVIIVVLLVNALAVLLQALKPDLQTFFAPIFGFDKSILRLRGFGLTAGYDTAGFLCVSGFVLTTLFIISRSFKKNMLNFFLCSIFVLAALFTSRSTIIILSVALLFFGFLLLTKYRGIRRLIGIIYIVFLSVAIMIYIGPLLFATLRLGDFGFSFRNPTIYLTRFASTDILQYFTRSWIMPDNFYKLIFGSGTGKFFTDMGFIRIIYMLGLVGFLLIFVIYGFMWFVSLKLLKQVNRINKCQNIDYFDELQPLLFAVVIFIPGLVLINIKNLYFLARSYHELLVIIFAITLNEYKLVKKRMAEEAEKNSTIKSLWSTWCK